MPLECRCVRNATRQAVHAHRHHGGASALTMARCCEARLRGAQRLAFAVGNAQLNRAPIAVKEQHRKVPLCQHGCIANETCMHAAM